jgi:hypothetical protein
MTEAIGSATPSLAIGFAIATSVLHSVIGTLDSATLSLAIGSAIATSDLHSVIGTIGSATPSMAIGSATATSDLHSATGTIDSVNLTPSEAAIATSGTPSEAIGSATVTSEPDFVLRASNNLGKMTGPTTEVSQMIPPLGGHGYSAVALREINSRA